MSLTMAEVEHIAELAKLGLSEDEKVCYQEQLSAILDHFRTLQQVDTSQVSPTATVLTERSVMRNDEVRPSLPTEEALANAPATEDGYFRVRVILEE